MQIQAAARRGERRTATPPQRLRRRLAGPINGSAGIWGPSSIACAQLAQTEINAAGGLLDRQVRLRVIDSSDEALEVGSVTAELMHCGAIDAIVGMHTSQVRPARAARRRAPDSPTVYTPLYEGGERTPGVFALARRRVSKLRAGARVPDRPLSRSPLDVHRPRLRLAARVPHRLAARYVGDRGGEVLGDRYLPFGTEDYSPLLDEIRRLKPNAVLLSLVGQDAVHFNRAFGDCGLSRDVFRLSCAIEENGLLAIGAGNTDGLFVSSGYFASLDNDANMAFKERYHNHFGERAPTLNALGQSTYEGVHFMAALAPARRRRRRAAARAAAIAARLPLGAAASATWATTSARSRRISPRPAGTCSSGRSRCRARVFPARDSARPAAGRKPAIFSVESISTPQRRRIDAPSRRRRDSMTLLAWLFGLIVLIVAIAVAVAFLNRFYRKIDARHRAGAHRLRRPAHCDLRRLPRAAVPAQGRRDQHAHDAHRGQPRRRKIG